MAPRSGTPATTRRAPRCSPMWRPTRHVPALRRQADGGLPATPGCPVRRRELTTQQDRQLRRKRQRSMRTRERARQTQVELPPSRTTPVHNSSRHHERGAWERDERTVLVVRHRHNLQRVLLRRDASKHQSGDASRRVVWFWRSFARLRQRAFAGGHALLTRHQDGQWDRLGSQTSSNAGTVLGSGAEAVQEAFAGDVAVGPCGSPRRVEALARHSEILG